MHGDSTHPSSVHLWSDGDLSKCKGVKVELDTEWFTFVDQGQSRLRRGPGSVFHRVGHPVAVPVVAPVFVARVSRLLPEAQPTVNSEVRRVRARLVLAPLRNSPPPRQSQGPPRPSRGGCGRVETGP